MNAALRDAMGPAFQRILAFNERPASGDRSEVLYGRVRAAAPDGDHSRVTRTAGTAEQAVRPSDRQTLLRMP